MLKLRTFVLGRCANGDARIGFGEEVFVGKTDDHTVVLCSLLNSLEKAHGKRNAYAPNNPNAWLSYRMALMRKSASAAADRGRVAQESAEYPPPPPPTYFNVLKAYMQQGNAARKTDGYTDDTLDRGTDWKWDVQPNKYIPSGRTYYEEQVLDPGIKTN